MSSRSETGRHAWDRLRRSFVPATLRRDRPTSYRDEIMEPAFSDGMPGDVLIVEDDPIIALGFEDMILGLGVKTIRTAGSVARALEMIADRAPDFALLDVGLVREKSFAIAERLEALTIPFVFVTGYGAKETFPGAFAHTPRLIKPCSTETLEAVLKRRPDSIS